MNDHVTARTGFYPLIAADSVTLNQAGSTAVLAAGDVSLEQAGSNMMFAIGGGLMVSWGVMMWLIADRLYPREPEMARNMIKIGVATWFVVDSAASIAAGAPMNALFNTGFVVLYGLALRRPVQTANA